MSRIYTFFLIFTLFLLGTSCKPSTKVTCPGSGQNSASDMNLFDEDGKPIVNRKKKKKVGKKNENGLINRDQPAHMKRHIKKSINDTPKKR